MDTKAVLIPLLALMVGVLTGLQVNEWIGGEGSRPSDPSVPGVADPLPEGALEREEPRPRVETASSEFPAFAARQPAGAPSDPEESGEPESEGPAEGAASDSHLEYAFTSGLLKRYITANEESWDWLLIDAYLGTGNPDRALAVFMERPKDVDQGMKIALALEAAGDPRAADAAEEALRLEPWDSDAVEFMLRNDPNAAITVLREALGEDQVESPYTKYSLAKVLAATENETEATFIALDLVAQRGSESDWDLLQELDPELMEAQLRARMASGQDTNLVKTRLASYLIESGELEEARSILSLWISSGESTEEARTMLRDFDPETSLTLLETIARRGEDPDVWSELGEGRIGAGNREGAIDAWVEAFRQSPGNSNWASNLEVHALDQLMTEYTIKVQGNQDDELWGDFGDVYSRRGMLVEALECYETARSFDKADSEWVQKISSLREKLGLGD